MIAAFPAPTQCTSCSHEHQLFASYGQSHLLPIPLGMPLPYSFICPRTGVKTDGVLRTMFVVHWQSEAIPGGVWVTFKE